MYRSELLATDVLGYDPPPMFPNSRWKTFSLYGIYGDMLEVKVQVERARLSDWINTTIHLGNGFAWRHITGEYWGIEG